VQTTSSWEKISLESILFGIRSLWTIKYRPCSFNSPPRRWTVHMDFFSSSSLTSLGGPWCKFLTCCWDRWCFLELLSFLWYQSGFGFFASLYRGRQQWSSLIWIKLYVTSSTCTCTTYILRYYRHTEYKGIVLPIY
jgi:hypothetical protein